MDFPEVSNREPPKGLVFFYWGLFLGISQPISVHL
jgi:hypothetical protein